MYHYDFTSLDRYFSQLVSGKVPGEVAFIAKDNEVIYQAALGTAQKFILEITGEAQVKYHYLEKMVQCRQEISHPLPMTPGHLFDIASLTKIFTTIGIMLLVDDKKIDIDKPVAEYLPVFKQAEKKAITSRHLLSHTSGLPAWKPLYYHAQNKEEVIKFIDQLPLENVVGTRRVYSDMGFIVLGYLIEYITEQSLDIFLEEKLFQPLGLKNTCFNPGNKKINIAATSHGNPFEYKMIMDESFVGYKGDEKVENFKKWREYTLKGEVNDGNAYYAMGGISGHAGLFSTVEDLHKVLQMIIHKGYYKNVKIIEPDTVRLFTTKDQFGHGLGFAMSADVKAGGLPLRELAHSSLLEGAIGHTGFTGTYMLAIPSCQLSMVLLTNVQNLGVNKEGRYHSLQLVREAMLEQVIDIINPLNASK